MDIALVGIGKIARDQHVPAIGASLDWNLAATVSRHGVVDGVDAYTDFANMLRERPEIRVISLCMPPVPRFGFAELALQSGRHLMLEKPPGATLSECYILEELARAKGVSIYATWHAREAAMVASAKEWLEGKKLRRLAVTWKEDVRRWHPGQEWIFKPGGLGVFDPGINALSILTEIVPGQIRLTKALLAYPKNRQAPIAAALSFGGAGSAKISAEFDFRQQGEEIWTMEIETDCGQMTLSEGGAVMTVNGIRQDGQYEAAPRGEYPRLYDNMARLVNVGGRNMDLAPLRLVADAFLLGHREIVADFEF